MNPIPTNPYPIHKPFNPPDIIEEWDEED